MNRRSVIKSLALASVAPAVLANNRPVGSQNDLLIGVQIAPQNILDEGLNRVLDNLQETAQVNALFLLSHGYYGAKKRSPKVLAPDHSVPVRDERTRTYPWTWVKHDDGAFTATALRHAENPAQAEYTGHDIFHEIKDELDRRKIALYARFYEALFLPNYDESGKEIIKNWDQVRTTDIFSQKGDRPCWNNPDYVAFMEATVRDMFQSYQLDGVQYGSESDGPLSKVLLKGEVPFCFCEFCKSRNRERGIDPDRALTGFKQLYQAISKTSNSSAVKAQGLFVYVQSIIQKYPEVIAWNHAWFQSEKALHKKLYKNIKSINPRADVGWHVDHQRSTWDLYFRTAMPYAEMAETADYIKPIMYHEVMGQRMKGWVIDKWKNNLYREFREETILQEFYDTRGYDPELQPRLEELSTSGFHPQYVQRETDRCVSATGSNCKTYSGIGIDIPWNDQHQKQDLESITRATEMALEAGADGIVISREYGEMRIPSLKAIGRAIADLK